MFLYAWVEDLHWRFGLVAILVVYNEKKESECETQYVGAALPPLTK